MDKACSRIVFLRRPITLTMFVNAPRILVTMKINRDMVTRAALKLLNEDGIEQLTLRRLGQELRVQAATIYWHFKSKEELVDEMASTVLGNGVNSLFPKKKSEGWKAWAEAFGKGLRKTLLAYRDGAKMVSGTKLTNDDFVKATDELGSRFVEEGFSVRAATVLGTTIYNYTLSFVIEEQAVFPIQSQRDHYYAIEKRKARFTAAEFPFHSRTSSILFDQYDRRYREGLELILNGARPDRLAVPSHGRAKQGQRAPARSSMTVSARRQK